MVNAQGPIVDVRDPGTNTAPVTAERRCEHPTIELTGVKYRIRLYGVSCRDNNNDFFDGLGSISVHPLDRNPG